MNVKEPGHKTTIRMPLSLHKAARIKAIQEDTTLSDVVREFIALWVAGKIEVPSVQEQEPDDG